MPETQTVHVVDDDAAARDSLQFLLESARLKVETHDSAGAFFARLPSLSPGCIITDVRMPGLSGIDLLKHIHNKPSPIPVIVITGHGDVALAVEAMKHGAVDFFEKPFDDERLLAAVRSALNSRFTSRQTEAEKTAILAKAAALTPRERQVLDGLVAGRANKQIAFDLSISPRTVEIYRANVMSKMDVTSLSELVKITLTAGLIESSARHSI